MHILNYIDPGAGSLLFQAIISGAVTTLLFFKKIKVYLKRKLTRNGEDDPTTDELI